MTIKIATTKIVRINNAVRVTWQPPSGDEPQSWLPKIALVVTNDCEGCNCSHDYRHELGRKKR